MCGRVALYDEPGHLARMLDAGVSPELLREFQPSWNVAPTDRLLGVYERQHQRELAAFSWGLVPSWAKSPADFRSTFNARAETIATKPMFRSAFMSSRILVPVDAFYEWETLAPKVKQPYAFRRADGDPIVFAGLRAWWRSPEGVELNSATIITTAAGPDMPIHDRQPVVLEPARWDEWLDPELADLKKLETLLVPTSEGTLIRHPVSKDVGNVRNDRPALIEAVALDGDAGLNSL
jgi:putative SOS response-associated peptidase YedK